MQQFTHLTANPFTEKSKEGDINLIESISQILVNYQHPNPYFWLNNDWIAQARENTEPTFQRFMINRYWRIELTKTRANVNLALFSLKEKPINSDSEYLKDFENYVLPYILMYSLGTSS